MTAQAEAPPASDPVAATGRSRGRRRGTADGTNPWLIRVVVLAGTLFVWWLVTKLELIRPLYLPSPGAVWDAFVGANSDHSVAEGVDRMVRGEQNYYLWEHLLASLQRIAIGVGAAIVVGIPLGLLMSTVRWIGHRHRAVPELPAFFAAAGLHRPSDRVVRYRRHLEGLVAVPGCFSADHDGHDQWGAWCA